MQRHCFKPNPLQKHWRWLPALAVFLSLGIVVYAQLSPCYDGSDKVCTCHEGTDTGVPCTSCVCEYQDGDVNNLCAVVSCPASLTQPSCLNDGTTVIGACTVDAVLFEGLRPVANRLVFQVKHAVTFTSYVAADCTNGNPTITWKWTLYRLDDPDAPTQITVETIALVTDAEDFTIPADNVTSGVLLLELQVTVTETSGVLHTYVEQTWLEAVEAALIAHIAGGTRRMVNFDDYSVDAWFSWDPEANLGILNFNYDWTYEILQLPTAATTDACNSYTSLTDDWRDSANPWDQFDEHCDGNENAYGVTFTWTAGWYRFEGAGGNHLADTPPGSDYICGTRAGVWMDGPQPALSEGAVCRKACAEWNGDTCAFTWGIMAMACPGFYVYYLPPVGFCHLGYCAVTRPINIQPTPALPNTVDDYVCNYNDGPAGVPHLYGAEGAIIKHTVEISYPGRLPGSLSIITELVQPGSDLFIYCRLNCDHGRVLAWYAFKLEVVTTMVGDIVWTVPVAPAGFAGVNWATDTTDGTDTGLTVEVLAFTFTETGTYTMQATLFVGGVATTTYVEYSAYVVTFVKPNDNPCRTVPALPLVLESACVYCDEFVYNYHPLTYEFLWWADGIPMAAVAFPTTPVVSTPPYVSPYTGLARYSLTSVLPSGVVNFRVRVTCVEWQQLEVDFSITIAPPTDPTDVWVPPLLDGPDSTFSKNLGKGDRVGAAALATSIAAVAVNIGKGNDGQGGGVGPRQKDKLKQLLEKVITKVDDIDTSNDFDVQLATFRALAVATSVGDLLTPLAMVSASNKTHFVLRDLRDRVAAGTPTVLSADEVNVACGAAFTAIAGTLKPAAEAARVDHNNGLVYSNVLVANQLVATSDFRGIDVMDDIYLNFMMTAPDITGPPWPPAIVIIQCLGLRIQREPCGDATNRAYQTGEFSPIILGVPSSADLTDPCDGSAVSGMSILHAEFNPFEYSNNSYMVRGTVVGLASKIGNATNHVTGLGPPVDVIIRRRLTKEDEMFSWDVTTAYIGNVTVVPFLVRYNGSSLHINIRHNYTDPPPVVNLFLRKDAPPTPEMYNWTVRLPTPQADLFTIPAGNDTVTASPYSWLLEPPDIDITEDDVVNKAYYFLGIQFEDGEDAAAHLNFSFSVMETLCVYFGDEWENEDDHLWHEQGCKPGVLSNSTHMHCRCNHLTKFTGMVAPNPINFSEVFTKDILQNPIGLILVLATFVLYLLLVLWARRKDRRDLTKVGVAPPQGHTLNPDPWCQYVITLYTGFKGGSGTTATVWINLFGDYGRTGPIALQDENRPLFEEGSVDSFLVSSPNIIGMIHVIHIWHENSGYSPEWFLAQIVLQEKATGRVVYFLCNRWLAVGEDDGNVERLLPVSSPEELAEFGNLVKAKVERDMNDGHLWFSVKGRPARSPFTRVQRLSCCLTLLYSTMVTNIMFFGQGDNYDSPEKIKIGGTEIDVPFDLPKLMISLQSAAIIMPVNLLIVFFFKSARTRPVKEVETMQPLSAVLVQQLKPVSTEGRPWEPACTTSPSDRTVDDIDHDDSTSDAKGNPNSSSSKNKPNSSSDKDTPGSTSNCQDKSLSERLSTSYRTKDPMLTYSLGLERTNAFRPRRQGLLITAKQAVASKFSTEKNATSDSCSEQSEPGPKEIADHKEKFDHKKGNNSKEETESKEEKGFLPWWTLYIGWLLVWSASFVAAFFTVLYTLSFGRPKAEAWCIAFVTSFLSDLVVIQPVKLVVGAVVFALFIKSPVVDENPEPRPLDRDEEYLQMKRKLQPKVTMPLNTADLAVERSRKVDDKKRRSAVIEVCSFAIFVLVVMMIVYNEIDPHAFYMNESVKNSLLHETEEMTFDEIADMESFWVWIQSGVLPTLYYSTWYNNMADQEWVIMGNKNSWLVGSLTLRQARLDPGLSCQVPELMQTYTTRCTLSFSPLHMATSNHSVGWQNVSMSNDTAVQEQQKPWLYTEATDVFPTFGEHGIYISGGYSTTLGPPPLDGNQSQSQLLQGSGWLDENSRAVMVEVILYNPNANLFSVVTFLVEFTYYGNAFPSAMISTLRLFQTSQILLLALKGVMVLFLLIFVYKEGKLLMALPVEYLQEMWNWVELLVILAGFSTLGVYFQTQLVIDQVSERGAHSQFSVYRRAAGWAEVYTYVKAVLICCVTLKLVRLLRFNKVVQVLFLTIRTSFKPLAAFMMMAGIVIMAFTQLGSLLFGANLKTYSSIGSSLASICLMTIGSFDTAELTEVSWIYGPIFFFLFQVTMQFFLMTMFMAILMDTYADVNENAETQKLRMMAYMREEIITKKRKMQQTVKNKRKPPDTGRLEIRQVNLRGDLSVYRKTFDHANNTLEYGAND
ncbi:polycystin-1-like protein 2 isoform X2 [Branchiostoma lanceolatum]|uniref:polycystin-1-like protein 2 isoform X2 n=1 Tax=Branchiostoma lanceolatum TaxID=7740 RepID=UPI003454F8A0